MERDWSRTEGMFVVDSVRTYAGIVLENKLFGGKFENLEEARLQLTVIKA